MRTSRGSAHSRRRHSYNYNRNYNNNYISGSSAYKYDYDYYNEEYPQYVPQRRRIKHKKARKEKKFYYKTVNEASHLQAVLFSLGLIVIFCVSLLSYLYFTSSASHKSRELADLKNTLQTIEEKNVFYETEISKSIDTELVEKTAKMRLGMSEPASHQIRYINVPKQSYTTQNKE